jgi:hypothetical protein
VIEWVVTVLLAPALTADALVPDRVTGAIPSHGHSRTPKTTKAASGLPGRPFARSSRVKLRLGKASHVLEPAIDAHRIGGALMPATRKRMAARRPGRDWQLGSGLRSQFQGQHGQLFFLDGPRWPRIHL